MSKEKKNLIGNLIVLGLLSAFCCFGIYHRLTNKIANFTDEDIRIIKGTLKQKPIIKRSAKGDKTLEMELNEYKNVVFTSYGVYLQPIDQNSVLADNNSNDSIQISILKSDNLKHSVDILELKTENAEYLTLKKLNENLAIERPMQDLIIYPLTFGLIIAFLMKLLQLINRD